MVAVVDTVRRLLDEQGRTQVWVIQKMNLQAPGIDMDRCKFSAIITGKTKKGMFGGWAVITDYPLEALSRGGAGNGCFWRKSGYDQWHVLWLSGLSV